MTIYPYISTNNNYTGTVPERDLAIVILGQSNAEGLFADVERKTNIGIKTLTEELLDTDLINQPPATIDCSYGGSYADIVNDPDNNNYWWDSINNSAGLKLISALAELDKASDYLVQTDNIILIWSQGEADSINNTNDTLSDTYQQAVINIINTVRSHINNLKSTTLDFPLFMVKLGRRQSVNYTNNINLPAGMQIIRDAQDHLITTQSNYYYAFDGYDKSLIDTVHYDFQSSQRAGYELAHSILKNYYNHNTIALGPQINRDSITINNTANNITIDITDSNQSNIIMPTDISGLYILDDSDNLLTIQNITHISSNNIITLTIFTTENLSDYTGIKLYSAYDYCPDINVNNLIRNANGWALQSNTGINTN